MSTPRNSTRSASSLRGGDDYIWQYEYYEDEEPVSFEGLKAHRYSIVIGFWVGLAVFVIFIFFVLTLLTKTGGPHQEHPEGFVKSVRVGASVVDIGTQAFCRPLLENYPSSFQQTVNQTPNVLTPGELIDSVPDGNVTRGDLQSEFSSSNIVVTSEPDLSVTNGDLLLSEPPIIIEHQSCASTLVHISN